LILKKKRHESGRETILGRGRGWVGGGRGQDMVV
jgi:hypothetical protein